MEQTRPTEDWNKPQQQPQQENKKIVAGIFALLLGSLGIHKFYLGYTQEGVIQIVISVITCGIGGIIPFIEGILYLVKSDEEFYQTYQVGKKGWF
ncbi:TM2 domain-containing protein [Flavobacterium dankookense]|jgi:TM2 domain-containing membrane protein YozV|uniref:TM2 domain-containing membrane protein YozV n=1 Tax=Flavobacterium dankookense TaxID=706186 RepID=A0A4R6QDL4_9FLAO|nr:TM2 domain-containing protein [Flavobacterium dankookense]TDP59973.1 TM2 domain-containing membrane protein YozV [Flavobacterium dankookense]